LVSSQTKPIQTGSGCMLQHMQAAGQRTKEMQAARNGSPKSKMYTKNRKNIS
jgi:hypothetical protein